MSQLWSESSDVAPNLIIRRSINKKVHKTFSWILTQSFQRFSANKQIKSKQQQQKQKTTNKQNPKKQEKKNKI